MTESAAVIYDARTFVQKHSTVLSSAVNVLEVLCCLSCGQVTELTPPMMRYSSLDYINTYGGHATENCLVDKISSISFNRRNMPGVVGRVLSLDNIGGKIYHRWVGVVYSVTYCTTVERTDEGFARHSSGRTIRTLIYAPNSRW